jgi:predicted DNA-binding transcriptional regulator YafY
MYQPTIRLLKVLELLQARPQMRAAELAHRLEVDGWTFLPAVCDDDPRYEHPC